MGSNVGIERHEQFVRVKDKGKINVLILACEFDGLLIDISALEMINS